MEPIEAAQDYSTYPEPPLHNRIKLTYDWTPVGCGRLLDAGCAYGYGTRHFTRKAAAVWGLDPNPVFISVAQARYPDIHFVVCGLECTPMDSGFFDVIILSEVIEHVTDERESLNELHRILAPGGRLILTTPHRGLFSFLDNENFTYHLRKNFPRCYRWLYRLKYGQPPADATKPGYAGRHRHYSLNDLKRLLDHSDFGRGYEVLRVFQSGFFFGVFCANMFEALSLIFGMKVAGRLCRPLRWLADQEFFMSFGPLSWNIAVMIKKQDADQRKAHDRHTDQGEQTDEKSPRVCAPDPMTNGSVASIPCLPQSS